MPELPEAETNRRYLERTSLRQQVTKVVVRHERVLVNTSPEQLGAVLTGRCFERGQRYGRHLLIGVEGGPLLHMRFDRQGGLAYRRVGEPPGDGACAEFAFDNGCTLLFEDPRGRGEISLEVGVAPFVQTRNLGPDALEARRGAFVERLGARRGTIKGALMRQDVLAGIGTVYADEILFHAGVHPRTHASTLGAQRLSAMHETAGSVLAAAIAADGDPSALPGDFLLPHRRSGATCPRCADAIERVELGRSVGYACPSCQPRG